MPSSLPTVLVAQVADVDNEGESWDSNEGKQIDNEGEDFGSVEGQSVDNKGEAWESNNQVNNEDEDWSHTVDNEGEDWVSDAEVDNKGEDWSKPKTSNEPSAPTLLPTPDPTIDLKEHLENMKKTYFCSESWENIDCAIAQSCPSGDSKGENFLKPSNTQKNVQNVNTFLFNKTARINKSASVAHLARRLNQLQMRNQKVEDLHPRMYQKLKVRAQLRLKQLSTKRNQNISALKAGRGLLKVVIMLNPVPVAQTRSAKVAKLVLQTHLVAPSIPPHLEKV